MSKVAPWLALSVDWQDSEMFDDAPHGVRLAWICLLCLVKAQGRAGKVRFRGKAFAENYRLSIESVDELLECTGRAGAVVVEGDLLTVVNWKAYQDPKTRNRMSTKSQRCKGVTSKHLRFTKTSEKDATQHPPPSTTKKPPSPPHFSANVDSERLRRTLSNWLAYKPKPYKPLGLKALVSRIENRVLAHGEQAVVDAIERAMAQGYKGWDFDEWFDDRKQSGGGPKLPTDEEKANWTPV